jgi:hypothetical protein
MILLKDLKKVFYEDEEIGIRKEGSERNVYYGYVDDIPKKLYDYPVQLITLNRYHEFIIYIKNTIKPLDK